MNQSSLLSKVVVGLQWGDEGKGKIVDYLAKDADFVIRFNGGNNAGHTVVVGSKTYKFHHLPSGAVYKKKLFIAQGAVINPKILLEEIAALKKQKIQLNLRIDPRVHIVMPYHQALDSATEEWKGDAKTGSLKLGIGYCYEDKNNRVGIRFEDLITKNILAKKIKSIFPLKKSILEKVYKQKVNLKESEIINSYTDYGKKLKKYLGDVSKEIWHNWNTKNMLFETAHGTYLDPAFGTYPYTVAPNSTAGAVFSGVGIGPVALDVIGVVKAYTTRVGNGPFPTEQKNNFGEFLQTKGIEIGTTSGRKRRCGWLDLVMLRSAVKLNNVLNLALTKLDVLTGLKEIKVATHYKYKTQKLDTFPALINNLDKHRPVYKSFPGWTEDISNIKKFSDLPGNCRKFLEFISFETKLEISYISVGPQRDKIILL